jgi:hypothetical protein
MAFSFHTEHLWIWKFFLVLVAVDPSCFLPFFLSFQGGALSIGSSHSFFLKGCPHSFLDGVFKLDPRETHQCFMYVFVLRFFRFQELFFPSGRSFMAKCLNLHLYPPCHLGFPKPWKGGSTPNLLVILIFYASEWGEDTSGPSTTLVFLWPRMPSFLRTNLLLRSVILPAGFWKQDNFQCYF